MTESQDSSHKNFIFINIWLQTPCFFSQFRDDFLDFHSCCHLQLILKIAAPSPSSSSALLSGLVCSLSLLPAVSMFSRLKKPQDHSSTRRVIMPKNVAIIRRIVSILNKFSLRSAFSSQLFVFSRTLVSTSCPTFLAIWAIFSSLGLVSRAQNTQHFFGFLSWFKSSVSIIQRNVLNIISFEQAQVIQTVEEPIFISFSDNLTEFSNIQIYLIVFCAIWVEPGQVLTRISTQMSLNSAF